MKINEAFNTDDDTMHAYTAIVIDPEKNEFKVIKGKYADKKEVYKKLSDRGYVVRKVLESSIYDWISKNAKTNLEAYAMFSTAFSKWRGNNILSDEYVKLLNDIPHLNRERRKGDPNSKKGSQNTNESALQEEQQYYKGPEVDTEYATEHDALIYPITRSGEYDPKYKNKPIKTRLTTFDTDNPDKRFDDPNFYRNMFKLMKIDAIGGRKESGKPILHSAFDVILDGDMSNPIRMTSKWLLNGYTTKNKNPRYKWVPDDAPVAAFSKVENKLKSELADAKENGSPEEITAIETQLSDLIRRKTAYVQDSNIFDSMTPEEQKKFHALKQEIWDIDSLNLPKKEKTAKQAEVEAELDKLKKTAAQRKKVNDDNKVKSVADKASELAYTMSHSDRSIGHGNPNFGGNPFDSYLSGIERNMGDENKLMQVDKIRNNLAIKFMSPDKKSRFNEINEKLSKMTPEKQDELRAKRDKYIKMEDDMLAPFKARDKELADEKAKATKDINEFLNRIEAENKNKIKNKINELPKDTTRPQKRKEILLKSMNNAQKAEYDALQSNLAKYDNFVGTKAAQDIFYGDKGNYDKSASKVVNDELVKLMSDEEKEKYIAVTNAIKKIDSIFKTATRLKNEKESLIAASKDENSKKISDTLNKLRSYQNSGKPIKLKKEKPDYSKSDTVSKTIADYNQNKLKKMGYDSSLDMSPYRKKESAVNDGASLAYLTQPKTPQSGGPISLAGTFMEDNIDETTTHSQLNQDLFENDKLKSDVKEALLKIADTFKETLELPIEPVDIYFTGSSANYNYNEQSDIDLHLVYDFENAGINADILSKYLQTAKKVFNDKYDIKVKGLPVEVGAENLNEPLVSTAIYSVMNDNWLRKPTNADVEIPNPDMPYYYKIVDEIENAIQSQDTNIIRSLWKKLGKLRKDSLAKEGEFGAGNALFKKLRNMSYLNRLKDAYYNTKSQDLSLESLEEII